MSGFGVKSPLRRAIITDDFFFNNDLELIKFLEKVHEGDTQKYFKHLPSEKIEQARQDKGNGVRIVGCQKSRMISLFPDGSWQIKRVAVIHVNMENSVNV